MSKKYREAARAKQHFRTGPRLQDRDIDGISEDEAALEAQQWNDEHEPVYEANANAHHLDEQIPF